MAAGSDAAAAQVGRHRCRRLALVRRLSAWHLRPSNARREVHRAPRKKEGCRKRLPDHTMLPKKNSQRTAAWALLYRVITRSLFCLLDSLERGERGG